MAEVSVEVARPEEKEVVANLFQLYTHDFSEHWSGMTTGELQDDGRFAPYAYLDSYWTDPGRVPFLVRVDGKLAGFVLLNDHAHSGRPVERNVAEFFVVRKHRRGGVGVTAAQAVFSRYPGVWEAAIARRNTGALAFWRKAIGSHRDVHDVEETDVATADWNGPIIRFRIEARRP